MEALLVADRYLRLSGDTISLVVLLSELFLSQLVLSNQLSLLLHFQAQVSDDLLSVVGELVEPSLHGVIKRNLSSIFVMVRVNLGIAGVRMTAF